MRTPSLAIIAGVLAGPALGLGARDCAVAPVAGYVPEPDEVILDLTREVPVDLGGGWVAQQSRVASEAGVQVNTVVTECASGANVLVVEEAYAPDGSMTLGARARAVPVFRAAIAAAETVTLDNLVRRLEEGGANVGRDLTPVDFEACGCAVFYPEARGDKTPWADWGGG